MLAAATAALATLCAARVAQAAPARLPSAPARLADTGLYSDPGAHAVDPRNLPYAPQYPLWTDGAAKRRWIFLPPGTAIDARDPDAWTFPIGTKLWKEFSWGDGRVETRYLERARAGWIYAAYAWREDGRDALRVDERGAPTRQVVAPGRTHVIPSVADCRNCHEGGRAVVLGFAALQLSPDRDPLAPHREPLEPGMVTLDTLVARGLLRGLPRRLLTRPPRIEAATPRARAAMGYLHANCGMCHDSAGPLASLGVGLRHLVGATGPEPAMLAVSHPARFRTGAGARSVWLDPGAPTSSAVVVRMGSRAPVAQMPPLGTQRVDDEALQLVRSWIALDLHPAETGGVAPPAR